MTAFARTTLVELKLFLRDPGAAFFTLLLPLILVMINAGAADDPAADWLLPGLICAVVATAGYMWLPGTIATYREQGILHRQRATPLRPLTLLLAHSAVQLTVVLAGLGLLLAVGLGWAGFPPPERPWPVAVGLLVAVASTCAIGFALASVVRTARSAQAVASALFFPMVFLSGAAARRESLPGAAQAIGEVLPLTFAVEAVAEPWTAGDIPLDALAVLAALGLGAATIAVRTFRWR